METTQAASSVARVETTRAQNYLIQLCKHFGHKTKVEYGDNMGRIELLSGACSLDASDPNVLIMQVEGADEAALAKLEDVAERHLVRFAFREELSVQWVRDLG